MQALRVCRHVPCSGCPSGVRRCYEHSTPRGWREHALLLRRHRDRYSELPGAICGNGESDGVVFTTRSCCEPTTCAKSRRPSASSAQDRCSGRWTSSALTVSIGSLPVGRAVPDTGNVIRSGSGKCGTAALQGVAYFHKQWGGRTPKAGGRLLDGRTWDELPVQGKPQERTLSLW
jgi:hypothetical protein